MNYQVLYRCFLVGILASSTLGPIFILTFNRGAIYGFLKGLATALGACIADGLYFFLGLLGVLTVLEESKKFMFLLDIVGGVLLVLLGIYSLRKAKRDVNAACIESRLGVWLIMIKSFVITIFNPLVLFFFIFIGVQVLPEGVESLQFKEVVFGSIMVCLGSLSILSIVALISSLIGSCINQKWLKFISVATGFIFIGVGVYFLNDFAVNLVRLFN